MADLSTAKSSQIWQGAMSVLEDPYEQATIMAAMAQSKAQQEAAAEQRAFIESTWDEFQGLLEGGTDTAKMLFEEMSREAASKEAMSAEWAGQRADARVADMMADPKYQMASQYLTESFAEGVPSSIAQDYAGRLRTAQAARGLERGGAPTQQEAALLTNMAVQNRQELLPQLLQLADYELNLPAVTKQQELAMIGQAQGVGLAQLSAQSQAYATQMQSELAASAQLAGLFGGTAGLAQFSDADPDAYRYFLQSPYASTSPSSGGFVPSSHFSFVI